MVYRTLFITVCSGLKRSFSEWRKSVASITAISPTEAAKMCLSRETLEGLHITGMP